MEHQPSSPPAQQPNANVGTSRPDDDDHVPTDPAGEDAHSRPSTSDEIETVPAKDAELLARTQVRPSSHSEPEMPRQLRRKDVPEPERPVFTYAPRRPAAPDRASKPLVVFTKAAGPQSGTSTISMNESSLSSLGNSGIQEFPGVTTARTPGGSATGDMYVAGPSATTSPLGQPATTERNLQALPESQNSKSVHVLDVIDFTSGAGPQQSFPVRLPQQQRADTGQQSDGRSSKNEATNPQQHADIRSLQRQVHPATTQHETTSVCVVSDAVRRESDINTSVPSVSLRPESQPAVVSDIRTLTADQPIFSRSLAASEAETQSGDSACTPLALSLIHISEPTRPY